MWVKRPRVTSQYKISDSQNKHERCQLKRKHLNIFAKWQHLIAISWYYFILNISSLIFWNPQYIPQHISQVTLSMRLAPGKETNFTPVWTWINKMTLEKKFQTHLHGKQIGLIGLGKGQNVPQSNWEKIRMNKNPIFKTVPSIGLYLSPLRGSPL
jgi:hypothetical protein